MTTLTNNLQAQYIEKAKQRTLKLMQKVQQHEYLEDACADFDEFSDNELLRFWAIFWDNETFYWLQDYYPQGVAPEYTDGFRQLWESFEDTAGEAFPELFPGRYYTSVVKPPEG